MTISAKLVCIEPQVNPQTSFQQGLERRGYQVSAFSNEQTALEHLKSEPVQVAVVNALSAAHRGEAICHLLRAQVSDLPILLLLPAGAKVAKNLQANVVLIKPFTIRKVVNRIKKLLAEPRTHIMQVGDVRLNCRTRLVQRGDGAPQKLTPKQAALLETLMTHPGKVLTRSYLMKKVWHTDYMGDTRTLDVHIRWVREKIEPDPSNPIYVITKRGIGYRFARPKEGAE
jgi:DNA-binding response OmpR family regulator